VRQCLNLCAHLPYQYLGFAFTQPLCDNLETGGEQQLD
jgi:hypothetical protein